MSWATKRRLLYIASVTLFFAIVVGGPLLYKYATIPPTCTDRTQNQGETDVDKGGPCPLVDERALNPIATLWSRSFRVRDGSYNAVAYVSNTNRDAGIAVARYRFRLYDAQNVIVAEREGETFIMPGGVTPIFEAAIPTGNRIAARAFFDFTEPLVWQRAENSAEAILVNDKQTSAQRLEAQAHNNSVQTISDISFVAVIFDTAGNAFAASGSAISRLGPGEVSKIVFTWPDPFPFVIGRVDIIPLVAPKFSR